MRHAELMLAFQTMHQREPIGFEGVLVECLHDAEDLLRQAQGMLVHNRCVDDDAMQCQGCRLEAAIQEALR